jgi:predicted amidohydrolase
MQAGICQFNIVWENREANRAKIGAMIAAYRGEKPLDWLILPEMTLSGFSMKNDKTTLDAGDIAFFSDLAQSQHMAISFGGVQDRRNWLFTVDNQGQMLSRYAKMHLFSFAHENTAYLPGDAPVSFILGDLRVSPFVCYDLRFADVFWRLATCTDVFVVVANWPQLRIEAWNTLLKARAMENQAYVIGVNRIGSDTKVNYPGKSAVLSPWGTTLLDCGDEEGIFGVELRPQAVSEVREKFPVLQDRRS